MNFKETLPITETCPPIDAIAPNPSMSLFRLVPCLPVVDAHFDSYAALGRPQRSNVSACRWSSCSLFDSMRGVTEVKKLASFRESKVVQVTLDASSGLIKRTKPNGDHHDWWRYANFDPVAASREVVED